MTGTDSLLAVNLTVHLDGRAIVDDVSFAAAPGEFVGLLGPNGAGKSTLLRTLAGLQPASGGRIEICGQPLQQLTVRRRAQLVAVVPQSTDLDFAFSVADVVLMGRHPYLPRFGVETSHDHELATAALTEVGFAHLADRTIGTLSGGERQLVFLAKAITQATPLLLLDEPISALDVRHQLRTLTLVSRLCQQGSTVVAALHDLELAARFCDRLLVMRNGAVAADGPPSAVITEELMADVYGVTAAIGVDSHTERPSVTILDVVPEPISEKEFA